MRNENKMKVPSLIKDLLVINVVANETGEVH